MLPLNEWLHHAKKLAVGQSKRVRHNLELTCAMNVSNLQDRYVAYCQRCKTGAVHMKDFVNLAEPVQQGVRHMGIPKDAIPLGGTERHAREQVYQFLVSKGLDPNPMCWGGNIPDLDLKYSPSQHRLIFMAPGSPAMGRALGNTMPKWLDYEPGAWWCLFQDAWDRDIVLVEDVLSVIKVQRVLNKTKERVPMAVCCHGTAIRPALMEKLLLATSVTIMLDGDNAGQTGSIKMERELRSLGIPDVRRVRVPDGLDPKDMQYNEIREALPWLLQ